MLEAAGCQSCHRTKLGFPFTMAFQPIVDLEERRIAAHEALVRGPGGESASDIFSRVTADNFYAFDQACRAKAIDLAGSLGLTGQLNVNFMPNAIFDPEACFNPTLKAAAQAGFLPSRITFELCEQEQAVDEGLLGDIMEASRRSGFKIALDDFATGYSSLYRLAKFRPDIIKIDRAIVRGCAEDKMRLAILASMLRLGQEIGVAVVIEGVETGDELSAVRSVGARFIQGFYFCKPILEGLGTEAILSRAW